MPEQLEHREHREHCTRSEHCEHGPRRPVDFSLRVRRFRGWFCALTIDDVLAGQKPCDPTWEEVE